MVKGPAKVYIFMPLACCHLQTLMRGRKRLRKSDRPDAQADEGLTREDQELEKHCKSLVPEDFQTRLARLVWMLDVANALQDLHRNLRNKEDMRRGIVLHGDMKAANILYSRSKAQHPLQISDFGTSKFRYAQPCEGEMASSSKKIQSQLPLASNCPNYPPEGTIGRVDGSFDIWGFGVVFAEFVAWVSGGSEALKEFEEARARLSEQHDGPYRLLSWYKSKGGLPILKDGIGLWFRELIETTDEPQETCVRVLLAAAA